MLSKFYEYCPQMRGQSSVLPFLYRSTRKREVDVIFSHQRRLHGRCGPLKVSEFDGLMKKEMVILEWKMNKSIGEEKEVAHAHRSQEACLDWKMCQEN